MNIRRSPAYTSLQTRQARQKLGRQARQKLGRQARQKLGRQARRQNAGARYDMGWMAA